MPRAREMMIDVPQGARAINERLIHRDIKPDNILIDDTRLKIGDFGISKVIDDVDFPPPGDKIVVETLKLIGF
jgi:serine/threonine protein kinase